ncbi:hypothetical protein L1987_14334 [Smallanthus sonchifolius]|uniref:Uncharacterized protein n=1 Tax=Smallanthus sonchifolius TaxID=185202 RepID=A0ACB9J4J2_9ASTR|nr:hypothetical protein L1987_14334 [Smallanthus sonchifolius]
MRPYHKDEKDSGNKVIFSKHKVKRLTSLPQLPGINADFHLALAQPNTTTEINDGETGTVEQNVGQERVTSREERQLRLLYEINEKLNSIQSEIRSRNTEVNKHCGISGFDCLHNHHQDREYVALCHDLPNACFYKHDEAGTKKSQYDGHVQHHD